MVKHDEIAVLEVEAVQLVAGALGVEYIFIDNVGGAFGIGGDALADSAGWIIEVSTWMAEFSEKANALAYWPEFPEEFEQLFGGDVEGQVLGVERSVDFGRELGRAGGHSGCG